jgi:hypothetical protein
VTVERFALVVFAEINIAWDSSVVGRILLLIATRINRWNDIVLFVNINAVCNDVALGCLFIGYHWDTSHPKHHTLPM